jgi:hypothetical protein
MPGPQLQSRVPTEGPQFHSCSEHMTGMETATAGYNTLPTPQPSMISLFT